MNKINKPTKSKVEFETGIESKSEIIEMDDSDLKVAEYDGTETEIEEKPLKYLEPVKGNVKMRFSKQKISKKAIIQENIESEPVGNEPMVTCVGRKDGSVNIAGKHYVIRKKKVMKVGLNVHSVLVEAGWA